MYEKVFLISLINSFNEEYQLFFRFFSMLLNCGYSLYNEEDNLNSLKILNKSLFFPFFILFISIPALPLFSIFLLVFLPKIFTWLFFHIF